MKTFEYKKIALSDQWREYNDNCTDIEDVMTFADYVQREADNDPGFFRWLFDDDSLSDFECKDEESFEAFIESIS